MWPLAALTGFYYKKIYGHFAGTKKRGRTNKVAVLTRWPLGGVPLYSVTNGKTLLAAFCLFCRDDILSLNLNSVGFLSKRLSG